MCSICGCLCIYTYTYTYTIRIHIHIHIHLRIDIRIHINIRTLYVYYIVCTVHVYVPKVGIRNLSPHLRNSATLRTTKTIAELRTKKSCGIGNCGPSKFDFRNSATLSSFLPVRLLSSPFSSAQDSFKHHQKYFKNCLFLWKSKTLLKGTLARDF
jgi:hypothetical protein